jgi:hypothetical protein
MESILIFKYGIGVSILIVYLTYTIRYTIKFRSVSVFNRRRKIFHYILIWIFAFFWIMILKSFLKPTHGSDKYKNKKDTDGFADNTSGWVMTAESASSGSGNQN